MGIVSKFDFSQIEKMLEEKSKQLDDNIIRAFRYLGEKCVSEAKTSGSYQDRTSNLRNSIGFVILRNGSVVDKEKGIARDKDNEFDSVISSISNQHSTGYVLAVVAGMNYALYVESKGKDVLVTAEQYAEAKAKEIVARILKQ